MFTLSVMEKLEHKQPQNEQARQAGGGSDSSGQAIGPTSSGFLAESTGLWWNHKDARHGGVVTEDSGGWWDRGGTYSGNLSSCQH